MTHSQWCTGDQLTVRSGMLGKLTTTPTREGQILCDFVIDPKQHIYLKDHAINGTPTMPTTFAMNLVCEVATQVFPFFEFNALVDFRIFSGMFFPDERVQEFTVKLTLSPTADGAATLVYSRHPRFKPHFGCTLKSLQRHRSKIDRPPQNVRDAQPQNLNISHAYEKFLFHGRIFQGVRAARLIDPLRIFGTVRGVPPALLLSRLTPYDWYMDPVAVDCAMQLAALHVGQTEGKLVLPTGFDQFLIGQYIDQHLYHVYVSLDLASNQNNFRCDVAAFLDNGSFAFGFNGLSGSAFNSRGKNTSPIGLP